MQAISSRSIRCHPPGALVLAGLFVVVGLAIPGYTQTVTSKKSSTHKKETTVTQLATAEVDSDPIYATVEIRAFHVNVPEDQLVELRRRVAATRWPGKETVSDATQGVQLATMQKLAHYWATDYDWRKVEAKLNALPQFVSNIDGLDIQFIHVRSKNPNALPVIITHGWPGSIIEQLKIIGPLTDPTVHGGRAEDAFDVVIPSVAGYGFSREATGAGWAPDRIAQAWVQWRKRLGYTRYVAQGGDWGTPLSSAMARQ